MLVRLFPSLTLATEIDNPSVDEPNLGEHKCDNVTINNDRKFSNSLDEKVFEVSLSVTLPASRKLFNLSWSANLHKRVHANMSLYQENVVAVGSYSHPLFHPN